MEYDFKYRFEHIEVYDSNGNFVLSADNICEAERELIEFDCTEPAA